MEKASLLPHVWVAYTCRTSTDMHLTTPECSKNTCILTGDELCTKAVEHMATPVKMAPYLPTFGKLKSGHLRCDVI